MLSSVQRFRTVSNQPFLNRGTVRRGGLGGGSILRFASELKNMLLHNFRLEAKASAEAAGDKRIGTAGATKAFGGRGYSWQGVRRGGKDAGYAANGTLAFRCLAGS